MKKFIYSIIAVAALALAGCHSVAKDEVRHYAESAAEKAVAHGAFSGTWTRVDADGTATATGTITFSAATEGDGQVAILTATCADFGLNNSGLVNIMHAGDDIIFSNNKVVSVEEGGFGAAIYGRICGAYGNDPKIIMDFKIEQRDGRKLKTFEYSFN